MSRHNSSLWLPKRFIYSSSEQNLSPRCYRKSNRTAKCRNMHVTHTIWVHSFPCTPVPSQKAQSYPAGDYVVPSHYRSRSSTFLSQCPFVRHKQTNKKNKTRIEHSKWDPDQDCVCKTGTVLHVEKQLMQMMFSNNSIQAALEAEGKRMLLIAREQAGGEMGRWVHCMLPFRN